MMVKVIVKKQNIFPLNYFKYDPMPIDGIEKAFLEEEQKLLAMEYIQKKQWIENELLNYSTEQNQIEIGYDYNDSSELNTPKTRKRKSGSKDIKKSREDDCEDELFIDESEEDENCDVLKKTLKKKSKKKKSSKKQKSKDIETTNSDIMIENKENIELTTFLSKEIFGGIPISQELVSEVLKETKIMTNGIITFCNNNHGTGNEMIETNAIEEPIDDINVDNELKQLNCEIPNDMEIPISIGNELSSDK